MYESSSCSASSLTLDTLGGVSCVSVILTHIYLVSNNAWQYFICLLGSLYLSWKVDAKPLPSL